MKIPTTAKEIRSFKRELDKYLATLDADTLREELRGFIILNTAIQASGMILRNKKKARK